jgi:predicted Zn finger-like uncharacterized protein
MVLSRWPEPAAFMRIACPSCAAVYEVPEAKLIAGRIVRCTRCGAEWRPLRAVLEPLPVVVPAEPAVAPIRNEPDTTIAQARPANAAAPRIAAMDRLIMQRLPPRRDLLLWASWAASWVLIALLLAGAYGWREEMMRAWPASIRLYTALGLQQGGAPTQGPTAQETPAKPAPARPH